MGCSTVQRRWMWRALACTEVTDETPGHHHIKRMGTQKGERKGGEQHYPGAAKYCQTLCGCPVNKQELVSGRSTDLLHPCGFKTVFGFLLCPQFQQSFPSVCSHTPQCLQARSSSQAGFRSAAPRWENYGSDALTMKQVVLTAYFYSAEVWFHFVYPFLSAVFFKCVCRFDFTEADDESTAAGDKAHTSVRRKNVDNLTIS